MRPGTPLLSPPPILYSPQQPQAVGDAPQKKEEPTKTTMPSQYATELPNKAPHIQPTLAPPNDAPFTAPYGLAPQPLPIKLVQPAPVLTSPPVTPPPVRPPPLTLVLEPGESNGRPYPVPPIITNPKPHNETHPVKLVHDLDQAVTLNITGSFCLRNESLFYINSMTKKKDCHISPFSFSRNTVCNLSHIHTLFTSYFRWIFNCCRVQ